MKLRSLLAATAAIVALGGPAAAHHVDPFDTVDRAFAAYQDRESYADARAVLSAALREAPHDGRLDPSFGIVYAIYADTARFEGDAAFSLQLADEGLALVDTAAEPDTEIRNALVISRAYALAELGRYAEAVDEATIAALWLEQRFGAKARADLETEIRGWLAMKDTEALPSVAQAAADLLQKAETALVAGDTSVAIALASRAILPDNSGLGRGAERLVNAWCRSVTGAAYGVEGRHRDAVATLHEAVNLLSNEPWDGLTIVALYPGLVTELADKVVWDVFIRLGSSALFVEDLALADAALRNVADYATTPKLQYSLLVQRAAILLRSGDLAAVAALFRESERAAEAAGNPLNAALARFYASVAEMRQGPKVPDAPGVAAVLEAARAAANASGDDLVQVEYILTAAVRLAVGHAPAFRQALPVSNAAFAAFEQRQATMRSYEAGQEAVRRDRRRFLETHVRILHKTSRVN